MWLARAGRSTLDKTLTAFVAQTLASSPALYCSSRTAELNRLYRQPPTALDFPRQLEEPSPVVGRSVLGQSLLYLLGFYSKEVKHLRGAHNLYEAVKEKLNDSLLFKDFNLPHEFFPTQCVANLHIWLLLRRLRVEGAEGKAVSQSLHEAFQEDVEQRVRASGVIVRLNRTLVDLEKHFYGSCLAYDQAMAGNGELSQALLRNVYGDDSDCEDDAMRLERYVAWQLSCLQMTDSQAVLTGNIKFAEPSRTS